ncbi:MAG: hypothetical protein JWL62_3720, partial [Hyphomicrobiales bacterium]|nr:hypothetical protein [Hyphomicrobiales bacterium]
MPVASRALAEVTGRMTIRVYQGDLPADADFGSSVAIDTETLGLNP